MPFSHGMGLICDEQYQVIQIVKSLLKILWFSTYLNKKKCGDRWNKLKNKFLGSCEKLQQKFFQCGKSPVCQGCECYNWGKLNSNRSKSCNVQHDLLRWHYFQYSVPCRRESRPYSWSFLCIRFTKAMDTERCQKISPRDCQRNRNSWFFLQGLLLLSPDLLLSSLYVTS